MAAQMGIELRSRAFRLFWHARTSTVTSQMVSVALSCSRNRCVLATAARPLRGLVLKDELDGFLVELHAAALWEVALLHVFQTRVDPAEFLEEPIDP
jgi:hypothetical protein